MERVARPKQQRQDRGICTERERGADEEGVSTVSECAYVSETMGNTAYDITPAVSSGTN